MPKKTQEQIFLSWCEEKGMKLKKTKVPGSHTHYELNAAHDAILIVQGVSFKLNKLQDCDSIKVYFDQDGKWYGGTNLLWNRGLPWEPK